MRHTYTIFICFISLSLFAQSIDFEQVQLTPQSFWNGNDLSGDKQIEQFVFENKYDTSFGGYWSGGFSFSNIVDTVTTGFGNLYAAYTGIGHKQTANYTVGQNNAWIILKDTSFVLSGCYLTNTTFATLSMKQGDNFAKKFGGITGDDPDWFLLTIKGHLNGNETNTIDFYLADYRFSDNSQDYIITSWEYVDLSVLGEIDRVSFHFSSSDVGNFGINTPTFFAMDDFNSELTLAVPYEDNNSQKAIYPNPTSNFLTIPYAESYDIIDLTGKIIQSGKSTKIDVSFFENGIYTLIMRNESTKSIQQFIKH